MRAQRSTPRTAATAALLLAALAVPCRGLRADEMEQRCAEDARTLCPGAAAGDAQLKCLKRHRSEVSQTCFYALKGKLPPGKPGKMEKSPRNGKLTSCQDEIARYCSGKQGKQMRTCLASRQASLSSACAASLKQQQAEHHRQHAAGAD